VWSNFLKTVEHLRNKGDCLFIRKRELHYFKLPFSSLWQKKRQTVGHLGLCNLNEGDSQVVSFQSFYIQIQVALSEDRFFVQFPM
jgi:hypothetical protein